eukprot:1139092-Pelagomonas_calceolata.AAC.6
MSYFEALCVPILWMLGRLRWRNLAIDSNLSTPLIPTVELLDKIPQPDPTLVCCAFKRQRLSSTMLELHYIYAYAHACVRARTHTHIHTHVHTCVRSCFSLRHGPVGPRCKREPKDVEEAEGAEAAAAAVGGRDVFNEKPSLEDILTAEGGEAGDEMF